MKEKNYKAFIPWMGGKSRLAKQIVDLMPEHTCYCEVFAGGASVLFTKPRSKCEVLNDINGDLVNLYRVVQFHERALIAELRWQLTSREGFGVAIKHSDTGLTDIQRAARFLQVVKTCFGGKGGCDGRSYGYATTSGTRFNRRVVAALRQAHKRLDGVNVEHDSFDAIIKRYDRPHTLFFCDPPYLDLTKYKYDFGIDEHRRLNTLLMGVKAKFILTINDHKEIRDMYKGCYFLGTKTQYSIAINKNTDVGELIITNFKIKK